MKEIQYRYASNEIYAIVNISKIDQRNTGIYRCLNCGKEMIPRLGEIKRHHFAHKVIGSCSSETYLHELGKRTFYSEFEKAKDTGHPFILKYAKDKYCNGCKIFDKSRCDLEAEIVKLDLGKSCIEIRLESHYEKYRPDILLKYEGEVIFIEVKVTHKVSTKKIDSGEKIIEISIENEDDIEIIKSHFLVDDDKKVQLYNFIKEEEVFIKPKDCSKRHYFATLKKDGNLIVKEWEISYHYEV